MCSIQEVMQMIQPNPVSFGLEHWWEKALVEIDEALNDQTRDPFQTELDKAKRQIGGWTLF